MENEYTIDEVKEYLGKIHEQLKIFTCKDCKFLKGCPKFYENEKTKMVRCTEFKKA